MSDTTAIATTTGPDRTLRLRDLAIQADAVPLPVSLIPSAIPQPLPGDEPAVADLRADPPPDEGAQTQPGSQAPAILTVASTAVDQLVPDDAVLQSINAAIDAVRATLKPDADGVQQVPFEPQADLPDAGAADAAAGQHAAHTSAAVLSPAETASSIVSEAPPASTLENTAGPALEPVQGIVQSPPLMAPVLDDVTDIATAAVTIPSLGGVGLDALAGLLPISLAASSSSHDADLALPGLEDVATIAAIGVADVLHIDQPLAQEGHSPLGLIGSGLL
jgi:hypothetical protein